MRNREDLLRAVGTIFGRLGYNFEITMDHRDLHPLYAVVRHEGKRHFSEFRMSGDSDQFESDIKWLMLYTLEKAGMVEYQVTKMTISGTPTYRFSMRRHDSPFQVELPWVTFGPTPTLAIAEAFVLILEHAEFGFLEDDFPSLEKIASTWCSKQQRPCNCRESQFCQSHG